MKNKKWLDSITLGFFGIGIASLVDAMKKIGVLDEKSKIIPILIMLGGLIQIFTAIKFFKEMKIVLSAAFGSYGVFWIGTGLAWAIKQSICNDCGKGRSINLLICYIIFLLFAFVLTSISINVSRILFVITILIDMSFVGLVLISWGIERYVIRFAVGVLYIIIGLLSLYIVVINIKNSKKMFKK